MIGREAAVPKNAPSLRATPSLCLGPPLTRGRVWADNEVSGRTQAENKAVAGCLGTYVVHLVLKVNVASLLYEGLAGRSGAGGLKGRTG